MFTVIGKTKDGRDVIGSVYEAFATHGIPLDVILERVHASGKVVAWLQYVLDAVGAGVPVERACGRAIEACSDVLGSEHAEEVRKRFTLAGYLSS